MRVLFAILTVALAGLMWATIAAARHIRHARRRQRGLPVEEIASFGPGPGSSAPPPPPARKDRLLRQTQLGMH